MSQTDQVTPLDLILHSNEVFKRVPAIFRAYLANRNPDEHDCIPRIFERTVEKYPNRPVIFYLDRVLTYQQLNEEANRVAHYLRDQGLKRGQVVALVMHNRPEFLISLLAISKVGACAALLNTAQRGKVLAYSINLVEPQMLIVGTELCDALTEVRDQLTTLEEKNFFAVADVDTQQQSGDTPQSYINLMAASEHSPRTNLPETAAICRQDHYVYLYTSGTTGMPKAAITDHNRICSMFYLINVIKQLKPTDVYYVPLPLFHATGLLACWTGV
ncbi:MAG TPA: long-chain-acyl-CoA synthetase, partial [Gammaproteobacteria bacterium]|nr:long-chain-acyl-CoA synthetase [Gammaproteobacteria bacterium]